ncbi:MmgE/PrpD family protein [Acidiferrimicrobium sp. IK]|uniref:MmgE/PrpD family protein n=1 Tax=Acidiferrimicrobium sp. IK TaxID=2871700 RepID=UPI0021CB7BDB|nr:MmgE/PrpD family protein [Acidiferrimicrobium sp. IK]MCU4186745.1 MmgE/PrpD family protein [Acidiferrimicrobium sp. IK]
MTDQTLAQRVAGFAVQNHFDELPAEVVDSVRKRVLDILGICVAATPLDTSAAIRRYATSQGGRAGAHAIGVPDTMPAALAALVNGTLAHSLDYDDTHLPSVLHPSASVVPAALAAAEANGRGGRDLIAAIACGLEICVRLGMAGYDQSSGRNIFFEHGQHATSICGTLGAAVSAGMLAGLDEEGLVHVLGLAASMGSGVIEANRTGGTVKRMHCGWAAHSAIVAADLVAQGFTGPPTVLEGRFGFFEAWLHGDFYPEWVTDGLGEKWEVPKIFFKPYPANHFTHTAIDAASALREQGIGPEQIRSLQLGVAESIVRTIGEPIEVKRSPATGYMAQFSGPYAVAIGLLGGGGLGAGLDDYTDELARDPQRLAIMAKVDVVADPQCTAIFPAQFPSVLRATLRDGTEKTVAVLANRGGPDRPLTFGELALKFSNNAGRLLDRPAVERVEQLVAGLEQLQSMSSLFDALSLEPDVQLSNSHSTTRSS